MQAESVLAEVLSCPIVLWAAPYSLVAQLPEQRNEESCRMCRIWKQRTVMPLYWRPLAWAATVGLEGSPLLALHCHVFGAGAAEAGRLESRRQHPSVSALQCLAWMVDPLARLPQGHSPP